MFIHFYNHAEELPDWIEKLKTTLISCWESVGNIAVEIGKYKIDRWQIIIYPAVREIHGGPKDGETIFANFHFNINKILKLFDRKLKIEFVCHHCNAFFSIKGIINQGIVRLLILNIPPDGNPPNEIFYQNGPYKGNVEPVDWEEN